MAAMTLDELEQHVGEYIGAPSTGRGKGLALKAIREAITWLNMRKWWFTWTNGGVTLFTATGNEFTLPSKLGIHGFSWIMNSTDTKPESVVTFLSPLDFFKLGTTDLIGPRPKGIPRFMTVMEDNQKIAFDVTPSSAIDGRLFRIGYWQQLDNPPPSGGLTLTGLALEAAEKAIITDASWRIRRLDPAFASVWRQDREVAQLELAAISAMQRSSGSFYKA